MIPFAHRMALSAPAEDNPLWLVVLADMMTNLMLFFLVMFAMTLQGEKAKEQLARALDDPRGVTTAPPDPQAERAVRDFREEQTANALKQLFGDTRVDEDAIRVSLRDKLIFPTADDRLTPEAIGLLSSLAGVLGPLPNTVVIEGHTDNVRVISGSFRSNWELSVARADSVVRELVKQGMTPNRLVAAGYGEQLPAASNDDAAGRARNRRVEIVILRNTPPDSD
ncbi:MAG: OmpA family protein [Elusimicrobia bacterium]|nr:OmpA family protein [Elusimicrobiota bacterium]